MWLDEVTELTGLLAVLLLFTLVYYHGTRMYNYWAKLGVSSSDPKYPYLGDWYETAFSVKPACQVQWELYREYSKREQFVGLFQFRRPILFVMNPGLVKMILVKDFEKFGDRGLGVATSKDPLAGSLMNLEGLEWQKIRKTLNPLFNFFSKDFPWSVMECSDILCEAIQSKPTKPFLLNDVIEQFSILMNVTSILGVNPFEVDTFRLKQEFSSVSRVNRIRMALRGHLPFVEPKTKASSYFLSLLSSALEIPNPRKSLLKLLKSSLSELEMKANLRGFFVAGVEATTRTLCFALFEIAESENCQAKLYNEISSQIGLEPSKWSLEKIEDLQFLDQVLTETLRKYPGVPSTTRVTRVDVLLNGHTIPKGTKITIPIFSLQRDPKIFHEPEVFRPERSKSEYKRGVYLPFGDGPRGCISRKLSLRQMKIALCRLLVQFRFDVDANMVRPLEFDSRHFFLHPKGGIWLTAEQRMNFPLY